LSQNRRIKVFHKTIIAFAAAVALGCVPVATDALAAAHPHGVNHGVSHGVNGGARYTGGHRIYNSYRGGSYGYVGPGYYGAPGYYGGGGCGYGYGCPGYGVVPSIIGGILGGGY
jgi:hypothetical protein